MSGAASYVPFDELLTLLGEKDAVRLVAALGGTRVYVPRHFKPDSPVVAAIGVHKAAALATHIGTGIGGLWVELPRGPSGMMADYRRQLSEMAANPDLSESQIARKLRIHGRTVRRERARLQTKKTDRQGRLF